MSMYTSETVDYSSGENKNPGIKKDMVWFSFMVLNATFSNISVILWRSILLLEETGVPGKNHRHVASH